MGKEETGREMTLPELYDLAVDHGVDVDWWSSMPSAKSFAIFDPHFDRCAVVMDPWKFSTLEDEYTTLGHELGHCMTGSFYNRWAACDLREKCEKRADKWAVEHLVPRDQLEASIADGRVEPWELAEHFGVTEELIRKAICWYKHGNMAVDQYQ